MTTSLTIQQRRTRIIGNLKGNKPSIMVAKFADHARAQEAERRGEEYIRPHAFTFLILENSGEGIPITLETVQKIVDEQAISLGLSEEEPTSLQLQEATFLQRYDLDNAKEVGTKLQGVCLKGYVRFWWDELTRLLQQDNWAETMVFYVEYLTSKVECEGVKMDALRIRRHFAEGELGEEDEEEGKNGGKHVVVIA
ncbi:MAG: hypothetical protein HETSPECPRED_005785 [Heterodermia speciosa]|uniref:Uncharacterized protein n=1 Tax=Heterodermia speciosa TaxID=116794 RepID=A0A8H3FII1_9LECA|nr:MAG: hypothetical protein HETSPECPRED_005785 [Heterodermia speciosa]